MSIGLAIGVCQQALAQASVEKGKSVAIEIPVDSDTACNIEVTRGGEKTNVSVDPKSKKGVYEFAGRELGEETIRWEGKMKFRGLKTLGPCRGDGSIKVVTTESAEAIEAAKQAQKAEEEAKQAKAAMDAQAARLAELEAKLKAAEAEAAKTPEQKAKEARIAAEAKANAEAATKARANAEAKARANAEAKARANAEAKARANAEAKARAAARVTIANAPSRGYVLNCDGSENKFNNIGRLVVVVIDCKDIKEVRYALSKANADLQNYFHRNSQLPQAERDGNLERFDQYACANALIEFSRSIEGFPRETRHLAASPYSDFAVDQCNHHLWVTE